MPTLEEIDDVEDVDNMDFDPEDFDPRNPFHKDMPVETGAKLRPTSPPAPAPQQLQPQAQAQAQSQPQTQQGRPQRHLDESDMEQFKHWQVLYPVYFDRAKSHQEGRRVSKQQAVDSPLAQNIMNACRDIGIHCIFEANKTHPKDWANPGRVRVLCKGDENNMAPSVQINNKRHLYKIISDWLKQHPTKPQMAYNSQIVAQMQTVPEKPEPLAVPRGWQLNSVLPIYSRAVTGGEGSKDMMEQMQSSMFPGMQGMPDGTSSNASSSAKPKKIKVRK